MSCYKPLTAYRTATGVVFKETEREQTTGELQLPCGRCIGCRMRRASDAALRCMHEAQMHEENCVVALTYARGCLPENASLEHRDFQNFMKRLRWHGGNKIRYYMCGEYGDEKGRPHYHACLFGIDFRDREPLGKSGSGAPMYNSATLREIWGHGNVSVQDLCKETAGYVTRYIMKKQLGTEENTGIKAEDAYNIIDEQGKLHKRIPPYAKMSLKPGIGATWFEKYHADVYPHDYVVAQGTKHQTPRYYDKLLKRLDNERLKDVQSQRVEKITDWRKDGTRERLDARETVHLAKVRNLKRDLS